MQHSGLIVGLDGSAAGERALAYAKTQARRMGDCALTLCYVIEWSPFSFQTQEENAERHKRREEEIALAHERVVDAAVKGAEAEKFQVEGIVRHGDAAEILERLAVERDAAQIVVARVGARGLKDRIFGSVSWRLVSESTVPVTIIP